jgi:hypothetical protein
VSPHPKAGPGGAYERWRLLPYYVPVVAYTSPFDGHPSQEVRGYYIRPGARMTHWVATSRRKDARGGWWVDEVNIRIDHEKLKTCDTRFRESVEAFFENSKTKFGG